jgi:hypothetical protein
MRSVSVRARRGPTLLILLVVVTAVPAFADDPAPGTVVLQGRIHVPGGIAAEEETQGRIAPPVGVVSEAEEAPQGRIHVPGGVTAEEETPSVWELFLVWLQGRIQPPVG